MLFCFFFFFFFLLYFFIHLFFEVLSRWCVFTYGCMNANVSVNTFSLLLFVFDIVFIFIIIIIVTMLSSSMPAFLFAFSPLCLSFIQNGFHLFIWLHSELAYCTRVCMLVLLQVTVKSIHIPWLYYQRVSNILFTNAQERARDRDREREKASERERTMHFFCTQIPEHHSKFKQ